MNLRGERIDAAAMRRLVDRMVEDAGGVPGVAHASMAISVPFWSDEARGLTVAGIEDVRRLGQFTFQAGTADYFAATGTRILRGRPFTAADVDGAALVMVVSDGMARALWPGRDALGQCVRIGGAADPCRTVVGVAEDTAMVTLDSGRAFAYYVPLAQYPDAATPQLLIRGSGGADPTIAALRSRLQALLPGAAYVSVVPLADVIAPWFRAWQFGATMFVAFGVLALVVAALGLHSLIAYEVAQREQEFGVRMALGATRAQILRLVVGRGARAWRPSASPPGWGWRWPGRARSRP